ncbi:MAG TPA: ABC transporter permease [Gaiellaceae bacterium]
MQQLLFWRNREAAFFTFFLPIIFFLIFGSVYGDSTIKDGTTKVRGAAYLEAGMIGYGIASTAFAGLAITLVIRRESGVLKRVRGTPLPPATYLSATLASTLIVFGLQTGAILTLGRILYGVHWPHLPLSLLITLVVGAGAFAAMGLAITTAVHSAEGSSAVVNAIYLPMAIISGTFFSPTSYPHFLRIIADVLPLTYFTKLARDVMLHGEQVWTQPGALAWVAGWGAIGLAIAIRRFRWEPVER